MDYLNTVNQPCPEKETKMRKILSIFTTVLIVLAFTGSALAATTNPYGVPPELKAKADAGDPKALYLMATKY